MQSAFFVLLDYFTSLFPVCQCCFFVFPGISREFPETLLPYAEEGKEVPRVQKRENKQNGKEQPQSGRDPGQQNQKENRAQKENRK